MRQITIYRFEVGFQRLVRAADGRYDMIRVPVTTIEDTSITKTDIRAAIKAAGKQIRRGDEVYSEKVGQLKWYYELEDLRKIVRFVEETDYSDSTDLAAVE